MSTDFLPVCIVALKVDCTRTSWVQLGEMVTTYPANVLLHVLARARMRRSRSSGYFLFLHVQLSLSFTVINISIAGTTKMQKN